MNRRNALKTIGAAFVVGPMALQAAEPCANAVAEYVLTGEPSVCTLVIGNVTYDVIDFSMSWSEAIGETPKRARRRNPTD